MVFIMKDDEIKEKIVIQNIASGIDPLTGLYFGNAFFSKVEKYLKDKNLEYFCLTAIDIEHFHLFNKFYGREQGDCLLVTISEMLKRFQEENGGVAGYLGGDNFGLVMPLDNELLKQLRRKITDEVKKWNNTVGFLPAFGIYPISDKAISVATMYDHAKVALTQVIGNYVKRSCEYTSDMDDKIEEEIRLLAEIQEGIEKEEFTFYVQPQCDISKGKIVGGESLVRWKHSTKGLIPPGVFIPVLEKNGFIADLDRYLWEKVCKWLREWINKGYEPVPISINVSIMDIFSMDVPAYLSMLLEKYQLPSRLLKVEITESAYAENNDKVIRTVKQLRDSNLLVMMDDFGSGYSSLNMLKSIAVDVLKIDMRFLDISDDEQEKGIGILESVVNMASQMRIPVIVEGVETQTQENFLLKMGCRYTQGYYYYKPMPIEDFEKLICDERKLDLSGLWCRQIESVHLREFLDNNLFNDTVINNILGPAAFYDMYENNIEITRVNEQYFRLAGISQKEEEDYNKKFWNHVRDDDAQLLFSIFAQAYENPTVGAQGYIHFLRADGVTLWIYIRIYYLREQDGHKIFYGSLTDMTEHECRKYEEESIELETTDLTQNQRNHMEKYYGNLPCAFGVLKLKLDENKNPFDYEVAYANHELSRMSGGDMDRLRYLISKMAGNKRQELYEKLYQAAYLGEKSESELYSALSSRYFVVNMYQYQFGYVCCMMHDVTHSHIYEKTLNNVIHSFREVYYLHLQDNYCRMIYPDDNHLLDRGNYEEVVNRHFGTGKILPQDERNIRSFLSLENLKKALSTQESVEYKYRRSVGDKGDEWCLTSVNVCERHQNGTPKTAVVTIRSIEALMREKEDKKRQNMSEMLTNMSEGFFVYKANETEEIIYANPPTLKMFGCSDFKEFKEMVNNSFRGMIYPEDLNRVEWEIEEQIKHSEQKMDYIRYRITRKDGRVCWVDDCGHLEKSEDQKGEKLFYVFITDITDSITKEEKDRIAELNKRHND